MTRSRDQSVLMHFLGQERAVVRWRAMHCQNSFSEFDGSWHCVLHMALLRRESCVCKAVCGEQARLVAIEQPAVVIAAHCWQPECGKQLDGLARPKRTRDVVAEVDGCINATGTNIRDYGFEREQIGVDVGNDS